MKYLIKTRFYNLFLAISLFFTVLVNAQNESKINEKIIEGSEELTKFYKELQANKNIQKLFIGFVNYSEIDFVQLQELKSVKSLSFSFIKKVCIKDFIEKISTFGHIDSLRLSNSNIKNLPSTLYKLNFLNYLNFTNNKIKNISEQHVELHIAELDLHGNKLKSVDVLGESSFKRLDLTFNPLREFPYCLGKVNELEVLQIGNWKKLSIKMKISGFVNLKWLTYLISYDMINLRKDDFINNKEIQITNFRV